MKIREKHCKLLLLIILLVMGLALFSVFIDFFGFTGNSGLSERGLNTLIVFLVISPLTFFSLLNKKIFTLFHKLLNYLFSVNRHDQENIRTQYFIKFLFLLSFCFASFSIIDWIGITNSGLDSAGRITAVLFFLFFLISIILSYLPEKHRNVKKDNSPVFTRRKISVYSITLVLITISFFLLLKTRGNVITSVLMLLQIWIMLILISQILFVRSNSNLKINVLLSITVFMFGILVIELFLRYAICIHTTYLERDGFFNYISLYETKREGEKDAYVERYYVHKPYSDCTLNMTEFQYKLKTNSLGIRNEEISLMKDNNEFRIICLGDSFTEGFGTDEDHCWPRILEKELTTNIKNRRINIINAGVAGSDVVFEYTFLKEQLLKYSPDMVITCLNTSDISDITVRGGFQRFISEKEVKFNPPPLWEPVYARSYILRHIIHDFYQIDQLFLPKDRVLPEMLNSVEIIKSTLCQFKDLSEKNNFTFVAVLHPNDYQILENHTGYSSLAKSISEIESLHYYDMHDYFVNDCGLNKNNMYQFCWKIDNHFNSKGYFLMASGIENYLFDSGLLKKDNRE